jgi:hypothetical protein
VITWPLSGHIALALATGLACGIAATGYRDVISPSHAAIIGTLVVYPAMVGILWRLHRPGGSDRWRAHSSELLLDEFGRVVDRV